MFWGATFECKSNGNTAPYIIIYKKKNTQIVPYPPFKESNEGLDSDNMDSVKRRKLDTQEDIEIEEETEKKENELDEETEKSNEDISVGKVNERKSYFGKRKCRFSEKKWKERKKLLIEKNTCYSRWETKKSRNS